VGRVDEGGGEGNVEALFRFWTKGCGGGGVPKLGCTGIWRGWEAGTCEGDDGDKQGDDSLLRAWWGNETSSVSDWSGAVEVRFT